MADWTFSTHAGTGGRFLLAVSGRFNHGARVNATQVRGVSTRVDSFSSADPFGDSTAVLTFPALTVFDDLDAADLSRWLGHYSDIDLYWSPAIPGGDEYPDKEQVINPLTNQPGLVTPYRLRDSHGHQRDVWAQKVWEGFIASMAFSEEGLQVQCQGALFQLDRYLAKPFYPARPWPLERLVREQFDHGRRPQLRTAALQTLWPKGWARMVPKYVGGSASVYSPVAQPGTPWTGYTSRETGGWDHSLTGFVQDQLTVMVTRPGDGVTPGNQWTVGHRHSAKGVAGRTPTLYVRDRFRAPDFGVWVGTPGVETQLSSDSTQSENVIYGSGTDIHGAGWRNAVISENGDRTDYLPLAASKDVYPFHDNPALVRGSFVSESNTKFGTGFSQPDAADVAKQNLARDIQPGWTGSITLSVDPLEGSRWQIRAGQTVSLRGFIGSGATGIPFHVSAVSANPEAGTVELTVDTRYRDLLTVQEAIERTRDPLTPVKMLQVNRTSVMIPDVQAPWDYAAGSGYIPKASRAFHDYAPNNQPFPYEAWAVAHPPLRYPGWYVKVNAGASTRVKRWTRASVLTAEKGDISRTEFACYDATGHILRNPFHVSFWNLPSVNAMAMPRESNNPAETDKGPSPYIDNAFESINPATGQAWPTGNYLQPQAGFMQGWGNRQNGVYNRAGFSPGSEADGDHATGLLTDDASWHFDNTNNRDYLTHPKPGTSEPVSAITIYAMFYAEYTESVYFMGRLFRANPGSNDG